MRRTSGSARESRRAGTRPGPGQEDRAVTMATGLLNGDLVRLGLDGWRVGDVRFPLNRTLEVGFEVANG